MAREGRFPGRWGPAVLWRGSAIQSDLTAGGGLSGGPHDARDIFEARDLRLERPLFGSIRLTAFDPKRTLAGNSMAHRWATPSDHQIRRVACPPIEGKAH